MTLPMWSPFALLVAVCALPSRATLRRVNWLAVAAYGFTLAVWPAVGLLVWWLVW